ncbi:decorin-binding protein DbpB [Borreliella tanukii]|uniref:decorin-binding protein DbpB n=1 Tax=Borreliella tanukii TaxID=56146 RepID=UPI0026472D09|nr:decorin-binding protein DbpB [Borreliella tanukii]WKC79391.1 decorin-binding protein DbpB [Borreliella tanukii]WKC80309.1 decorin-binding protein DbpB [Borreliella tanukii]WKC82137.1 decorin-binding protein DbpB [Borreliella tanukii]
MKKLNLTILALFVALLIACKFELTGETKIALESSSRDVKDKILQLKKEAALKGVNFEAFTDKKTGIVVAEQPEIIKDAKVQAINETEKFLNVIEQEALKLKENGNGGQFLAMFDIMIEVVESLEAIGIKGAKYPVSKEAKSNPINTFERLLEAKVKIKNKLEDIKKKQKIDSEDKKNNKSKKKK